MKNQNLTSSPTPAEYIINDDFIDNRYGWEIVDSSKETAAMTPGGYQIENKDKDRWHHFSLFPEIDSLKGIVIKCKLEVDVNSGLGQVGYVDPGVKVRVKKLRVYKRLASKVFSSN